mgnify:CR=1 FL=1
MPKVQHKPIKSPRKGLKERSKRQPKAALVWRTGLSGVPPDSVQCTRELEAELATFGKMGGRSAIIHRTVRCTPDCPVSQRSNGYFAPTVTCRSIKCAPERADVRHARSGAPDTLQCVSGEPPDIQAGPVVRAPTVGTQRPGDVAGAPDSVWCAHRQQPPQRLPWWLGAINTPNRPFQGVGAPATY